MLWWHKYLLLGRTIQLHTMQAIEFGNECVLKGADVIIIGRKHPQEHLNNHNHD